MRDLQRWVAETKKKPKTPRPFQTRSASDHAQDLSSLGVASCGLRIHPLQQMQSGVDAQSPGQDLHSLSARSRAGADGHDGLQQVRGADEGRDGAPGTPGASDDGDAAGYASELGAIAGHYGSRIAALRRSVAPIDLAAAIKALKNEKILAIRAVKERRSSAVRKNANNRAAESMQRRSQRPILHLRRSLG